MATNERPDARESAARIAVNYIADKIYSGELSAGDQIPTEAELCAVLGISRTSVREAIKALEAQTVLSAQQGRGTYISQPEDISISTPLNFKITLAGISWVEIIEFRMMMEFLTLRDAIRNITDEDIRELDEINRELSAVRSQAPLPVERVLALESKFHEKLLGVVHNRLLKEMFQISSDLFTPITTRLYEYHAGGIDEKVWPNSHALFLEAMRNRDVFLAYHAATNMLPPEQWLPVMGEAEFSPIRRDPGAPSEKR